MLVNFINLSNTSRVYLGAGCTHLARRAAMVAMSHPIPTIPAAVSVVLGSVIPWSGNSCCSSPHHAVEIDAAPFILRTALSEMFEASRVPSGHGFPATAKNPQLDSMRLANLSAWAARGIANEEIPHTRWPIMISRRFQRMGRRSKRAGPTLR